jgi:hypothetical protein
VTQDIDPTKKKNDTWTTAKKYGNHRNKWLRKSYRKKIKKKTKPNY